LPPNSDWFPGTGAADTPGQGAGGISCRSANSAGVLPISALQLVVCVGRSGLCSPIQVEWPAVRLTSGVSLPNHLPHAPRVVAAARGAEREAPRWCTMCLVHCRAQTPPPASPHNHPRPPCHTATQNAPLRQCVCDHRHAIVPVSCPSARSSWLFVLAVRGFVPPSKWSGRQCN
jgi:hypothetical protein